MHVVVVDRVVFIHNRACVNFVPIEVQKSIISRLKSCADMSPKVARFDLAGSRELAQGTSVN
jgi:hypothetical protein